MVFHASLIVSPNTTVLPSCLNAEIAKVAIEAIEARGVFTIALSGGSLPGFLRNMKEAFGSQAVSTESDTGATVSEPSPVPREQTEPQFDKWHVILADERCVPLDDPESNMGALKRVLFSSIPVPESQIYGINESVLENSASIAIEYESIVRQVLFKSGGQLDLAVLGFGPDGHTCSLFPNHELLDETNKWIASIDDSPKPPPRRITMTYPLLNNYTRHVIFCGAGDSKAPILQRVFETTTGLLPTTSESGMRYNVILSEPAPFPCARVRPDSLGEQNTLTYIVDQEAMMGVAIQDE
ncbi:glucosamine-6-phosphate isomerase/6-phosphogluconolactonase [Fragilaria crotonensis]|nr:glucosamine-6-phosphate isomerase/6-phosphogluconolactonase [Fragilaria crotonensis]